MRSAREKRILIGSLIGLLALLAFLFGTWAYHRHDAAMRKEAEAERDAAMQYVSLPSVIATRPEPDEISYVEPDGGGITPSPEATRPPVRTATVTPSLDAPTDLVANLPSGEPTPIPETTGESASGTKSEKKKGSATGMEELYALNPDIAGWIRIPNTEIDYPFVAIGDKANKYLETSFDGKTKSKFGTIFTRNNLDDPSSIPNLVLFGHNMAATGYGMFTQLLKFKKNAEFAKAHSTLEIIIGDETFTYEFFCCYNIKTSDSFLYEQMSFIGPKDLTRYSEEILKRSNVKADGAAAGAAHYITLSTCDRKYDSEHGRFVVVFVRK